MLVLSERFVTDENDIDVPVEDYDASYYEELLYSELFEEEVAYQTYVWGD